jgi:hypothetical protein
VNDDEILRRAMDDENRLDGSSFRVLAAEVKRLTAERDRALAERDAARAEAELARAIDACIYYQPETGDWAVDCAAGFAGGFTTKSEAADAFRSILGLTPARGPAGEGGL